MTTLEIPANLELAERLYDLRTEHGFSQVDLSKRSGVARSTIIHLERGRMKPQAGTLRKLAKALDVPIHELTM